MFVLGPIGFTTPWLLLALAALPVLWWLLRAVPPAPIRRAFPGGDPAARPRRQRHPDRPHAVVAPAAADARGRGDHPRLRRAGAEPAEPTRRGSGPLLVFVDDGWAAAPDWRARLEAGDAALADAEPGRAHRGAWCAPRRRRRARSSALRAAGDVAAQARGPRARGLGQRPRRGARLGRGAGPGAAVRHRLDLRRAGHARPRGARARASRRAARSRCCSPPRRASPCARPGSRTGSSMSPPLRCPAGGAQEIEISGLGPDPAGVERELVRATLELRRRRRPRPRSQLSLPPELRNRVAAVRDRGRALGGRRHAGRRFAASAARSR